MKIKIKKLWVAALRSGKYVQGRFCMKEKRCFCVLGVLCDLHRKATGKGKWAKTNPNTHVAPYVTKSGRHGYSLPDAVKVWAGIPLGSEDVINIPYPNLGYGKTRASLASLNDGSAGVTVRVPFDKLADLIEEHL